MFRSVLIALVFLPLIFGCKEDKNRSEIPRFATDITININLPSYNQLLNPGGWVYVDGGSQGIIVYRLSQTDFTAFDRHCPFNPLEQCRIDVQSATIATDIECCGSEFEFISGSPISGPAQNLLLGYNTQFNPNANLLRIFN